MVRVGVCLSGCGVFDGSEIHESVLTLLALDRGDAEVLCMAPDMPQMHVIDHRTGKPTGEQRNALTEAARIARGKIVPLAQVRARELDALILPGGFGAAKNLCDFAVAGADAKARADLQRLLREMLAARKPIGAVCIAPAAVAAALKGSGTSVTLTIGDDADTARALEAMGARHEPCPVDEFRVDVQHRIVSTPADMYDARLRDVAQGVERLVAEVLRLARVPAGAGR